MTHRLQSAPLSTSTSHGQILKSSALIGSSQAMIVLISIVRTKLLAMLLGPGGYGLMTTYMAIGDLAASVGTLGVDRSGVRQIAIANGSGDEGRINSTSFVLRRLSLLLGAFAALVVVALSSSISTITFGSDAYAAGVALLSVAVLFRVVAGGIAALIQGLRRIRDLAMLGIAGAAGGTAGSVLIVYFLGEPAVAYAVVVWAAVGFAAAWWYGRFGAAVSVHLVEREFLREAAALIKLGFAFMASGFLMLGASYAVRLLIIRFDGLAYAGYYQAAWALGGLYIGTILQAMGADFYPRLSAAIGDSVTANRLVNEQTHISLLLAGPGIVATLSGSAFLLRLLYSEEFVAAAAVLHWICLGMALRVITWPIGYIIVAHGRQSIFLATELMWAVANVGLSWFLIRRFGAVGVGVAFMLSYVLHLLMIYPIVRRLTGFRWTPANVRVGCAYLSLAALTYLAVQIVTPLQALLLGGVLFVLSGLYALRSITLLVSPGQLPHSMQEWLEQARRRAAE